MHVALNVFIIIFHVTVLTCVYLFYLNTVIGEKCSKILDPVLYFVSAKQEAGDFEHNNLIAMRLPSDLVD